MREAVKEIRPKLEKSIQDLNKKLLKNNEMTDTLQKNEENLTALKYSITSDVKTRMKELHDLVDELGKELLLEVTEKTSSKRKELEACKERVDLSNNHIQGSTDFADQVLAHGKDAEILLLHNEITTQLQQLQNDSKVELPEKLQINYNKCSTHFYRKSIKDALGKIEIGIAAAAASVSPQEEATGFTEMTGYSLKLHQMIPAKHKKIKDRPNLVLLFYTNIESPFGITVNSKSEMLVTDNNKGFVHVYDKRGRFKYKIDIKFERPFNVLSQQDGTLLVSGYGCNTLFVLNYDYSSIVSKSSITSCDGLAVNTKNEIAVACPKSRVVKTYQLQKHGQIKRLEVIGQGGLFQYPWYVAYTSEGNIVVSDPYHKHKVTVTSPTGLLMYKYSTDVNSFVPYGICVDCYDNIIVAADHRIHLLRHDCTFERFLLTEENGLKEPTAVAINNNGDLVVTEKGGKVKIFKYLE